VNIFNNLSAVLFKTSKTSKIKGAIVLGIIIILALLPMVLPTAYYVHIFVVAFLYIISAMSLRLIFTSGQTSIAQAGMMGLGAYVSACLAKYLAISPWITIIIGTIFTFIISFLVAIPFSRLRGVYFSMVTLFFGLALLAINSLLIDWTWGYAGLSGIPRLFGVDKTPYYYFMLGLVIVCALIMYRIEHSRIGITWKAIAQAHPVASSIGVNERGQRMLVFAVGSLFAGLAGSIYGHYFTVLSQSTYSFMSSVNILIYVLVGGLGSIYGPIVGAAILTMLPELLRNLKEYVPYFNIAIMLLVLFFVPAGLAGLPSQINQWFKDRKKKQTVGSQ
jgi:branched-chain amino acid transport system permease protein